MPSTAAPPTSLPATDPFYDPTLAKDLFGSIPGSSNNQAEPPDEENILKKIQELREQKHQYFNLFKQLINKSGKDKKKQVIQPSMTSSIAPPVHERTGSIPASPMTQRSNTPQSLSAGQLRGTSSTPILSGRSTPVLPYKETPSLITSPPSVGRRPISDQRPRVPPIATSSNCPNQQPAPSTAPIEIPSDRHRHIDMQPFSSRTDRSEGARSDPGSGRSLDTYHPDHQSNRNSFRYDDPPRTATDGYRTDASRSVDMHRGEPSIGGSRWEASSTSRLPDTPLSSRYDSRRSYLDTPTSGSRHLEWPPSTSGRVSEARYPRDATRSEGRSTDYRSFESGSRAVSDARDIRRDNVRSSDMASDARRDSVHIASDGRRGSVPMASDGRRGSVPIASDARRDSVPMASDGRRDGVRPLDTRLARSGYRGLDSGRALDPAQPLDSPPGGETLRGASGVGEHDRYEGDDLGRVPGWKRPIDHGRRDSHDGRPGLSEDRIRREEIHYDRRRDYEMEREDHRESNERRLTRPGLRDYRYTPYGSRGPGGPPAGREPYRGDTGTPSRSIMSSTISRDSYRDVPSGPASRGTGPPGPTDYHSRYANSPAARGDPPSGGYGRSSEYQSGYSSIRPSSYRDRSTSGATTNNSSYHYHHRPPASSVPMDDYTYRQQRHGNIPPSSVSEYSRSRHYSGGRPPPTSSSGGYHHSSDGPSNASPYQHRGASMSSTTVGSSVSAQSSSSSHHHRDGRYGRRRS
jgi:hypothetical protein